MGDGVRSLAGWFDSRDYGCNNDFSLKVGIQKSWGCYLKVVVVYIKCSSNSRMFVFILLPLLLFLMDVFLLWSGLFVLVGFG